MYHNALVTTDGSVTAAAAFPHVAHVLAPDGRVTVVEVIDTVGQVLARTNPAGFELAGALGVLDADLAGTLIETQREEAERHLSEARVILESAGVAGIETLIVEGLPGERIVKLVQERDIDVVLMATHGRSGLRRTVLGSVADHVLRHLDNVPVLLVHPGH